ncbi:hypothetical protein PhCBS80983_g03985 [Powellomyces hirtus]|uniref:Uncharacterized protein n=1 Tax=Powellomyces hirtus TaxID=109895 RepID=A0A507E080_9FUNG|nr:hypothetical protein PhCBS80983_g03985 [Powellomyces hirtus]
MRYGDWERKGKVYDFWKAIHCGVRQVIVTLYNSFVGANLHHVFSLWR